MVGHARATALMMIAEPVDAEEAARIGMIWKAVDPLLLDETVDAVARNLASAPTRALLAIRQALRHTWRNGLDAQLDLERDLQQEMGRTRDYREGLTAFKNRREPHFEGL